MIYGLDSHGDVGECSDCLCRDYGENWQEYAFDYSNPRMPRDICHNGFICFIEDDQDRDMTCHICNRIFNHLTKKWE